ncbi:MAG: GNAT family N-acetyltransferase [Dehalococcoidia bacterium]|nr:GNAT family N-acetyltransferase [Dehalococcoidia bacterium]
MANVSKPDISFRLLTRVDFSLLRRWLNAPHVQRWWRLEADPTYGDERYLEEGFGPLIDGTDATEAFVIQLAGEPSAESVVAGAPIGLIQRCRLRDYPEIGWPMPWKDANAAGIDYFIGEEKYIDKGIGTEAIRLFARDVFDRYPEVEAIIVDPQQDNIASWRALEKAGFERVWAGQFESVGPSDMGPAYLYRLARPTRESSPV